MELVGYTKEEEEDIYRIEQIQDPEEQALAKEAFREQTGKDFPDTDFRPNVSVMLASMASLHRRVDPY